MEQKRPNRAKLFSLKYLVYDFVKLSAALPGIIWLRPRWRFESDAAKKPIRGGALLISNHDGFFDPVNVMFAVWYRRHHFICGKEFFESKARWWFERFLCIPIDRQNFNFGSLREITDELKSGSLVSIFPEGHINGGSGDLSAFKSGPVLIALQGRAPIVPVYVKPRAHFYNRMTFVIGEPIDLYARYGRRPPMSEIDAVAEELRQKEEELKQIAYQNRRKTDADTK